MATSNLTDKFIKAAKPGKHVIRLRDAKVPGFHLTITPNNKKSWALAYTSPETGKRRFYLLGSYTDDKEAETDHCLTLAKARQKAMLVRSLVDDEGVDPIEAEKRLKAETAADEAIGTTRQLLDLYIEDLELDGKRSAKQIKYAFFNGGRDDDDTNCKSIIHMKARDVTREHIADIIATVAERAPVQANRVRTYLHAAFAFGLDCHTRPRWRKKAPDFQLTHNPATLTKKAVQEKPGDRYLSKEEIKSLWNSIGVDALSADLAIALKLLLTTGQRVEEVLHAEWSEIDTEDKLWTIPASRRKTREAYFQLLALLYVGR
jgi:integrase